MKFKIKRILAVMLVFCMMMGVMPNMAIFICGVFQGADDNGC